MDEKRYLVGEIRIEGIEPTEAFKDYVKKERNGALTQEVIKKLFNKKYKVKEL